MPSCTSILSGSLLSLAIHRHHDYRSLGASGGVCGVIFASIFLLPGSRITMFPLPVAIPASVYAVLFLAGSFLAHRRQSDNIGHDAHLGGAIIGLVTAAILYPRLIFAAPWMFSATVGLSLLILGLLVLKPRWTGHQTDSVASSPGNDRAREYDENEHRTRKKMEIDRLLDKVARGGIDSLTRSERKRLDALSREVFGRR